ncbi:transcriptional regulator, AlpA family [Pasteurella testudinis DSM 23072]|uniref:Transcriptional regulator, AlpA family n=1 Tax=Pasteurella testudinis DSM 23072 TaxID=1122938 RepID=A0A1W1UKG3_9PAST|nr:AlpA family transcriptional regulator [Pasteurella testudinis]SMB81529.1 transcriptional regulator, AlpA family [Pasteurella testudinis DSM 23072]SUB51442.1 Predicted transcriptional regulator [Pasteurella testudinis]
MTSDQLHTDRILRLKEVMQKVGLRHSAIYSKINKGEFPPPIKLGARASGWRESVLDAWVAEREAISRT